MCFCTIPSNGHTSLSTALVSFLLVGLPANAKYLDEPGNRLHVSFDPPRGSHLGFVHTFLVILAEFLGVIYWLISLKLHTQLEHTIIKCVTGQHLLYSRTPDERPPSPTTIPLIRPHFVWRTVVYVRIRIPHEWPFLLYDRTNVILRVVV